MFKSFYFYSKLKAAWPHNIYKISFSKKKIVSNIWIVINKNQEIKLSFDIKYIQIKWVMNQIKKKKNTCFII